MSRRILVVEKDPRDWETLQEVFQVRGDEPVWVRNEFETFKAFGAESFDLVLIEALLPKIKGYELCRKLKHTPKGKNTPILLMGSIFRNLRLSQQLRHQYDADDVLVKPFDAGELKEKLDRYLSQESAEDAGLDVECMFQDLRDAPFVRSIAGMIEPDGELSSCLPIFLLSHFASLAPSGVLRVSSGKAQKAVYFQNGVPVFIASNLREESLGQILVRENLVPEEVYIKSLNRMKDTGRKQGEVLMEMGALSPHQLFEAMTRQMERKLLDLCRWSRGTYSYTIEDIASDDECLLNIDLFQVLQKAAMELVASGEAEGLLQGIGKYPLYKVNPPHVRPTKLNPNQRRLINLIDGKKSVEDLALQSDSTYVDFHALLVTLLAGGNVVTLKQEMTAGNPVTGEQVCSLFDFAVAHEDLKQSISLGIKAVHQAQPGSLLGLGPESGPDDWVQELEKRLQPVRQIDLESLPVTERVRAGYLLQQLEAGPGRWNGASGGTLLQTAVGVDDRAAALGAEIEFHRGLDFLGDGEFDEAVDAFNTASDLFPDGSDYLAYLGWATYKSDSQDAPLRLEKAQKLLDSARNVNRNNLRVHFLLGRIDYEEDHLDGAARHLERVLQLDPDNMESLTLLHQIEVRLGQQVKEAVVHSEVTKEVATFETMIIQNITDLYSRTLYQVLGLERSADYESLKRAYFAWSEEVQNAHMLRRVGQAVREGAANLIGRYEEAYEVLSDPERRKEYDAFLDLAEGRSGQLKTGSGTFAEREYQKGLEIVGKGEYRGALTHFGKALEAYPMDPRYHAYLGISLFRQNALRSDRMDQVLRQARERIGRALTLDKDCEEANLFLGEILRFQEMTYGAKVYLEKVLNVNPENLSALKNLYGLSSLKKMTKKALEQTPEDEDDFGQMDEMFLSYTYQIEVAAEKVKHQNFFEILEISLYADIDEIEKSYLKAKEAHSYEEILDRLDDKARERIALIQGHIEEAYQCMSHESTAMTYRRQIRAQMRNRKVAQSPEKSAKKDTRSVGKRIMEFLNKPV